MKSTIEKSSARILASALVVLALSASGPARAGKVTSVMVFRLSAERGVDVGLANVLRELLLAEFQKYPGYSALTDSDLSDLLSLERQKDILGCTDDRCMAELGGALGVEKILSGTVSRLGSNLTISLKLLDVVSNTVSRRETEQARDEAHAAKVVNQMLSALLGRPALRPATTARSHGPGGTGRLAIFTNPTGADIFLDSDKVGSSPLTIDEIPAGEHTLTITLEDYVEIAKRIEVGLDRETKVIESLLRQAGDLAIVTTPEGAQVRLDSKHKGKSPLTLEGLPTGTYDLQLSMTAYEPVERVIEVGYKTTARVNESLVPKPGKILFTSTPAGAEVWLDGEQRDTTNTTLELAPGSYELALVLDGYSVENRNIDVEPASPQTVSVVLKPGETVRPHRSAFPWRWVTASAAVAAAAGAIALTATAYSTRDDAQALPAGHPDVDATVNKGERLALAADATWLVTAALGVVTFVLFRNSDDPL